ncbi:dsDNA nuclease domain-containing protein [Cellulosilyticum sp. ST5]|uniref:dsDNA nuclease domain-containing protein n=1 Tax=Cellulosilyticum sp. ST5 TaxID=3055805 RepID=UPI0039774C37
MQLEEFFVKNLPREVAGTISSRAFSYQQEWALDKIITLFEEKKEFALVMDFHEDVVIFNSSKNPTHIEMFQIKTNVKKSEFTITPAVLKKQEKDNKSKPPKIKDSFLQKLLYNYNLFQNYNKTIYFVSTKPFNFSKSEKSSDTLNPIFLKDLEEEDFQDLSEQMCDICKKDKCKQKCKTEIAFEKAHLQIETSHEQLLIKVQEIVAKYGELTYTENKAIYATLMAQVRTINDSKDKYNCEEFEVLIEKYSISRAKLESFLKKTTADKSFPKIWGEIHIALLGEKYTALEIRNIKKWCEQVALENYNDFEGKLNEVIIVIDEVIDMPKAESFREIIEESLNEIYNKLSGNEIFALFEKEFFRAMTIMRWFNG